MFLLLLAYKLIDKVLDLFAEGAETHLLGCHLCGRAEVLYSIFVVCYGLLGEGDLVEGRVRPKCEEYKDCRDKFLRCECLTQIREA